MAAAQTATPISTETERLEGGTMPLAAGMALSVALHLTALGAVPLLFHALDTTVSFERPPTFVLVAAPPSLKSLRPALQKKLSRKQASEKKKRETLSEREYPEEDLDELSSVLDEIPAPTRIAAVDEFRYTWYLSRVQEKIERFWNPPFEGRNDSVIVSFTIQADGSIADPVVSRKSGSRTLDELALRAVRTAAPFGRLPLGVSGSGCEIICTLRPTRD
jgi:TonB family protein